jgi:hypothetical protein
MKLITDTLRSIQHLPNERLHLFTKKGALVYVQDGTEEEVQLPKDNPPKLKGRILIHNHPGCTGEYCKLSQADKELVIAWRVHKIVSICSCGNIEEYKEA